MATFKSLHIIGWFIILFLRENDSNSDDSVNRLQFALHSNNSTLERGPRNVKPVIYIGVILLEGDDDFKEAFDLALLEANKVLATSTTLQMHQLEPLFEVAPQDNLFAASQQACKLLMRGIVALFGPRSDSLSQVLLTLANRFGIPYIETYWNFVPLKTTYAMSMHPKPQSYGQGLFDYLTQVEHWKSMTIIHNRPESLLKFATLIGQFEHEIKVRMWDHSSRASKEVIEELGKSGQWNYLVDLPPPQVRDFLVTAFAHNMTGSLYCYVFTDWDVSKLDLAAFKVDLGARIKTISILSHATPYSTDGARDMFVSSQTPIYSNGITNQYNSIDIDRIETRLGATQYGLLHDSLLILAHGLTVVTKTRLLLPQALDCARPPGLWPLGLSFLNAMKAVPPDKVGGKTGHFRFDRQGLRTLFDLTTLELTKSGFRPSGVWNIDERMKIVISDKSQVSPKFAGTKPRKVLSVITKKDPPFMIPNKLDAYGNPLPHPEAWSGYCKDLLDRIAELVGFNYTLRLPVDDKYGSLVSKGESGKKPVYDGIMGELMRKEADMVVAAFTITYERVLVVDFSTPWMTIGGSILFTTPRSQKPSLFSFMQPLAPKVWLYVIAIYLAVCLCMFIAARLSPYEWNAPHPCDVDSDIKKNQFTMLNSFYYYISALLNQGVELAPQATSTRLLTGVWWFFGLIIIATYTANLAAFLTVENTKSPIESVEDLVNQNKIKYGTLKSGSSRDFFRNSSIPIFRKMGEFMDKYEDATSKTTEEGIQRVRNGGYAFILESAWNEYYVQRDCNLMQVGSLLDSKGYGIGFPQGSVWRDPVSEAILRLQNEQTLDKLKRFWWHENNISEPCSLLKERSKAPSPLGVEQVGGVFIMLLVGFAIGFIVAIIEFIIATRDQERPAVLRGMWGELKFAFRCLTTSKRLKSEMHKLPRSRSNLKLVASIPHSMNTTGPCNKFEHQMPNVAGESREPLILPQQPTQIQTHPHAIPMNRNMPVRSNLVDRKYLMLPDDGGSDYQTELDGQWTHRKIARLDPSMGRVDHHQSVSTGNTPEHWQFHQNG